MQKSTGVLSWAEQSKKTRKTLLIKTLLIYGGLFLIVLGVIFSVITNRPDQKISPELLEWTNGSGYNACIWINEQAYYGSNVENVIGTDKYIVYRESDYLVLPNKIIVKEVY